jgi:hypothetical protein
MSIVGAVLKELLGMFLADARLTFAVLLLVAVVAGLAALPLQPFIAGIALLLGCIAILVEAVHREARGQAKQ